MSASQDLRLFQNQASVVDALSESAIQLAPFKIKSIILRYCNSKLANRSLEQLGVKMSLLEHELRKTASSRGERVMPGLEAVCIEIRHELKLPPSVVFRSAPSSAASTSRLPATTQPVTRDVSASEGLAPPPAWTPRAEDAAPPLAPPRGSSDDDLARAMRESLLVAPPPPPSTQEVLEVAPSSSVPRPQLPPPSPSPSMSRPTFQSTYLSLPRPTPSSSSSPEPVFAENDPLEILTFSSYQTLLLVDDSRSVRLDSSAALEAISKLVPVVSLLSSPPEIIFARLKGRGATCGTEGEVRELLEAATLKWNKEQSGSGVGLGRKLGEVLRDHLGRLQREVERDETREMEGERGNRRDAGFEERLGVREDASRRGERIKPLSIIVLTDGTSSNDLESVLVSTTKRLDHLNAPNGQLGVFFLQLGNDPLARDYLLSLSKLSTKHPSLGREIADSTAWRSLSSPPTSSSDPRAHLDEEGGGEEAAVLLRKTLLGSINRRVAEVDLDSSTGVDV
ncbi:hypothetical protein BDY24DRAFT_398432 [Mrakia frigida]|uniref:uncharacterized protein n=1 Tax=Mrakia frigida TaxID=29902 RepID=UPI003FCBFD62